MVVIDDFMAEKVKPWLERNGALLRWLSVNLSNPSGWWLTPLGSSKPTWQAGSEPETLKVEDLKVVEFQEVRRIRIYTRISSSGLAIKLTSASDKRLNKAMCQVSEKTGEMPVYHFEEDYAIISIPANPIPFTEWSKTHA